MEISGKSVSQNRGPKKRVNSKALRTNLKRSLGVSNPKKYLGDSYIPSDSKGRQDPVVQGFFHYALEPGRSEVRVSKVFESLEDALQDPKATIVERKELGGGMNRPELVTLSNGITGVWKTYERHKGVRVRQQLPPDSEAPRDRAAYLIDKEMGHRARVPPVVLRELEGKSGTLTFFMDGAKDPFQDQETAKKLLFDGDVRAYPLAVFDNIIGNLDRHAGNWMIANGEHIVPIDHGMSFPNRNGYQGWMNYDFRGSQPLQKDTVEDLQELLKRRTDISMRLEPQIGKRATGAMFRRIEGMVRSGNASGNWAGKSYLRRSRASRLGIIKNQNYPIHTMGQLKERDLQRLEKEGFNDTKTLLRVYGSKKTRSKSKVPAKVLERAVKVADLMRITGIGPIFAPMLLQAGIDSVKELAQRNPTNLAAALNKGSNGSAPSESRISGWVDTAKLMSRRLRD